MYKAERFLGFLYEGSVLSKTGTYLKGEGTGLILKESWLTLKRDWVKLRSSIRSPSPLPTLPSLILQQIHLFSSFMSEEKNEDIPFQIGKEEFLKGSNYLLSLFYYKNKEFNLFVSEEDLGGKGYTPLFSKSEIHEISDILYNAFVTSSKEVYGGLIDKEVFLSFWNKMSEGIKESSVKEEGMGADYQTEGVTVMNQETVNQPQEKKPMFEATYDYLHKQVLKGLTVTAATLHWAIEETKKPTIQPVEVSFNKDGEVTWLSSIKDDIRTFGKNCLNVVKKTAAWTVIGAVVTAEFFIKTAKDTYNWIKDLFSTKEVNPVAQE